MKQSILVTGATGFVGSELVRALVQKNPNVDLTVLIRSNHGQSAVERLERFHSRWHKFGLVKPNFHLSHVKVIEHDFERDSVASLPRDFTTVYHAAAATDFDLALPVARRKNVRSTLQMLQLARSCPHLLRFVHFSTAFVAGNAKGLVDEDYQPVAFNNSYEQTKWESELAVKAAGIPFTILRPSIITGSSDFGYVVGLKVIYSVVRLWLSGILPRAPVNPNEMVDIVPIDFVVNAALAVADCPEAEGQIYNATVGQAVQNKRIIEQAMLTFGIPEPRYVPIWVAKFLRTHWGRYFTTHNVREALELMKWHIPYLGLGHKRFDNRKLRHLLLQQQVPTPDFAEFGPHMFRFCQETSWGRRATKSKEAQFVPA